jgi:hypothetical protein
VFSRRSTNKTKTSIVVSSLRKAAFDKACSVLLVGAGEDSSYAPAFRHDAAEDRNAAVASGIGGPQSAVNFGDVGGEEREVSAGTD